MTEDKYDQMNAEIARMKEELAYWQDQVSFHEGNDLAKDIRFHRRFYRRRLRALRRQRDQAKLGLDP